MAVINSAEEMATIVREHREKSGLTQKQLADIAGLGKTVIFDVEKGKTSTKLDTLLKIFNVLNLKLEIISPLIKDNA